MMKKTSRLNRLLGTGLILVLTLTIAISAFLSRTSSEPNTIYYLTKQRGDYPYTQYLLKSDPPISNSPNKITHPNNFVWRTDFQPSVLNFSSGSWSFNLWFETNESASCKLSLGYFTGFFGYIPITDTNILLLDQAVTKEYNFIFNDVPAFNIPPEGCLAFQLNASTANIYVDSTDNPSNIQLSTQQQTTTTTTETYTATTQSEIQTTESTITQQTSPSETQTESTSETPSTSTITSLTEIGDHTSAEYFTLTVHAHTIETQYPIEPTTELNVVISLEYYIDDVNKTETKSTLFIIEVDKGSVVNLTVTSFPPSLTWIEWDEYGTGRTSDFNISIHMNSDKNAIAYFSTSKEGGDVVYVIPGFTATSFLIGFLFAVITILLVRAKKIQMLTSL